MFFPADETLVWQEVDKMRSRIGAFLNTLDERDWDHESLCDGWLVRDVVAHLVIEYHYKTSQSVVPFLRSGLRVNTFLKDTAIRYGRRPPKELIRDFGALVGDRTSPVFGSPFNVLVDLLVHEQDIQIPLGLHPEMPAEALNLIFSHWEPTKFNSGEWIVGLHQRLRGLRFKCTDMSFESGDGHLIEGPAQAIMMAVTGRPVMFDRLRGDGVDILRDRLN